MTQGPGIELSVPVSFCTAFTLSKWPLTVGIELVEFATLQQNDLPASPPFFLTHVLMLGG